MALHFLDLYSPKVIVASNSSEFMSKWLSRLARRSACWKALLFNVFYILDSPGSGPAKSWLLCVVRSKTRVSHTSVRMETSLTFTDG